MTRRRKGRSICRESDGSPRRGVKPRHTARGTASGQSSYGQLIVRENKNTFTVKGFLLNYDTGENLSSIRNNGATFQLFHPLPTAGILSPVFINHNLKGVGSRC